MKPFFFAAIFFALASLPALAQVPREEQTRPGAVTGRLLSRTGTPAVAVRIAAVPLLEGNGQTRVPVLEGITQTDGDGRYTVEGLPPGRYYIFAGLIDSPNYYPGATALEQATALRVDSGATVSGIDFIMMRPTAMTVAGRIAYPASPRSTAAQTVFLSRTLPAGAVTTMQAKVDENGAFQFLQVAPGEYRLSATISGTAPLTLFVQDQDLLGVVLPVVDCFAGVRVSGRLAGVASSPVQSISVAGSKAGCAGVTAVASDGSFVFPAVPEGAYTFQLSPVPLGWSAVTLTVERADISNLEIQLPATLEVSGQVVLEDGSAPPRLARGALMALQAKAVTGTRGEVRQSILNDGTFALRLIKGKYRVSVPSVPTGYYVKSMMYGPIDLLTEELDLNVQPSAEVQIVLALSTTNSPTGVRLSGRLSAPESGAFPKPEGIILVPAAESRNAPILETMVRADGSFEFSGVAPGRYNLETVPDSPVVRSGIVVNSTDVSGIEFSFPVLIRVNGAIEWINERGVSLSTVPANLSIRFAKKEGDRLLVWAALVQAKDFHLYLPEGKYRFSIGDLPDKFDVRSVTSPGVNVLESGLHVTSSLNPLAIHVTLRGR